MRTHAHRGTGIGERCCPPLPKANSPGLHIATRHTLVSRASSVKGIGEFDLRWHRCRRIEAKIHNWKERTPLIPQPPTRALRQWVSNYDILLSQSESSFKQLTPPFCFDTIPLTVTIGTAPHIFFSQFLCRSMDSVVPCTLGNTFTTDADHPCAVTVTLILTLLVSCLP